MVDVRKLARAWIVGDAQEAENTSEEYRCSARDGFQERVLGMQKNLLERGATEDVVYILVAVCGEIGNNSFDHNVGSWRDVPGIFFGHIIKDDEIVVALADRGRGVRATLERVKPDLESDVQALEVAFTEKISGRAPENRGNGLKFVRESVKIYGMHLDFFSGSAHAISNEKFTVSEGDENIGGCLAIIRVKQ